jgi:MFS family permease
MNVRTVTERTFRSLRIRNYRLYFAGQILSFAGTWMQSVAQVWLVLKLGGGGVELGLTTALQFLPMLLFGVWGGVFADRFDKRRTLMLTQSSAAVVALIIGVLSATGVITLWMVYATAFALGCVTVVDNPTRQSFVMEMVGGGEVSNAVGLNSSVITLARIIGPALAGIIIAAAGVTPCFFINAASYLAVLVALAMMDPEELIRSEPVQRAKGQLREGLAYVWSTPTLRRALLLMAVVGTLAYNFRTLLPLMTKFVFDGGATTYGLLSALLGMGAVGGALTAAGRTRPTNRVLLLSSLAFGALILALAWAPTLAVEMAVIVPTGLFSILFVSTANATLQITANEQMRGRVMSLYAVVFLGSTPIGGPLVGWIAETAGARVAFTVGGAATVAAAAAAIAPHLRDRVQYARRRTSASEAIEVEQTIEGNAPEWVTLRGAFEEARERVSHAARSLPALRRKTTCARGEARPSRSKAGRPPRSDERR